MRLSGLFSLSLGLLAASHVSAEESSTKTPIPTIQEIQVDNYTNYTSILNRADEVLKNRGKEKDRGDFYGKLRDVRQDLSRSQPMLQQEIFRLYGEVVKLQIATDDLMRNAPSTTILTEIRNEEDVKRVQQERDDFLKSLPADRSTWTEEQKDDAEQKETLASTARRTLERYNDQQKRSQENKAQIASNRSKMDQLTKDILLASNIMQRIIGLVQRIDDTVTELIREDKGLNEYTKGATYVFGGLVGFVIVAFFVIAMVNRQVAETVFGKDQGLQFVTLFSLVIAIILFGILKILEARELAALLGGISGYILGRGLNSSETKSTPAS